MKERHIKNYIILKILNNIWKIDEKIPSEKDFIKKFGYSRTSIRSALQNLTHNDWLYVKKGSGYFVSGDGYSGILSLKTKLNANKTKKRTPTKKEKNIFLKLIDNDIEKYSMFEYIKEYYRDDVLVGYSYCLLNKNFKFYLDNGDIEDGLIKNLRNKNIDINYFKQSLGMIKENNILKKLNYDSYAPFLITELHGENSLIEKSFVLIEYEKFKFKNKIIF